MSAPQATSSVPTVPSAAATDQPSSAPIAPAPPVAGAAQPVAAPAPRRSRAPRGPLPSSSGTSSSPGAPALLELAAATPMSTIQRRANNFFVPDANFLFHVLSICDGMMGSTHRFLQSSPAWLPLVSQLYVSILWNFHILRIFVHTGYGLQFANLVRDFTDALRLDECLIPGPLVPFFEALAAVNGPFDWIGDVTPALPDFNVFWSAADWHADQQYLRSVPAPAVLLDQLAYFATWQIPQGQTIYNNFEWFRNIFSVPAGNHHVINNRIAPTGSGSLFALEAQVTAARGFWYSAMQGFVRTNAAAGQNAFTLWTQFFGFTSQAGNSQYEWFQHIAIVMQKYSQFFNGSRALKSISLTGLGSVLVSAVPLAQAPVRDWLYPQNMPGSFLSSRFAPIHEIPTYGLFSYEHSDHDVEEVAEQYAILCSTNMKWSVNNNTQHGWQPIALQFTHHGDYWNMMVHRKATLINLKLQYAQVISSRYHQTVANRSE